MGDKPANVAGSKGPKQLRTNSKGSYFVCPAGCGGVEFGGGESRH